MLRIRTKPHPTRSGVFIASFEGRFLCISRTPLADGARALLKMGFPPASPVTMRHEGAQADSFIPEPLANWAARAYEESPRGPVIREWKAFPTRRSEQGENSQPTTKKHPDDPKEPS